MAIADDDWPVFKKMGPDGQVLPESWSQNDTVESTLAVLCDERAVDARNSAAASNFDWKFPDSTWDDCDELVAVSLSDTDKPMVPLVEAVATPKYKERKKKTLETRSVQKEVAPKKKSAVEQEGDKGDDGDKKDKKGKDDGGKNKKLKGAKAAAKQEGADAQAGKTGVDLDDLEFDKVFSTCTAETNARFQITAHVRARSWRQAQVAHCNLVEKRLRT